MTPWTALQYHTSLSSPGVTDARHDVGPGRCEGEVSFLLPARLLGGTVAAQSPLAAALSDEPAPGRQAAGVQGRQKGEHSDPSSVFRGSLRAAARLLTPRL